MKTAIITIGLVLVLAMAVSAQEEGVGLTGKGIKVGLNLSNASGSDAGDVGTRLGLGVGAFLTYNFLPAFGIQPEVLYMMKGVEESEMGATMTWSADYLEIPILLKYTIPVQGSFKPNLFAGPALGLLMGSKIKMEYDGETLVDWDVKDGLKSTDWGIVFGGGVVYQMSSIALTFDVRYTMGITKYVDIAKFRGLEPPDNIEIEYEGNEDPDVKHTNISFMLGLSF